MYVQAVYYPQTASGEVVPVTLKEGAGLDEISQELESKGLISQPLFLKVYAKLSGVGSHLQAGKFDIPSQISIKELLRRLGVATREQASLRFTEGLRREEDADYISSVSNDLKLTSLSGASFSSLAKDPSMDLRQQLGERLPAEASLQGFLFPDTYLINIDDSAQKLLMRMLDNYKMKVTSSLQASFTAQGLKEYEALTLASLVEREGRGEKERPVIAGILLKRFKAGIPLGVDATLQYALGYSESEKRWWREGITVQDLALESPYNTRKVVGLPPRPICNPGLGAIEAVAKPVASPYLYYLHGKDRQIHYAKTPAEHEANIARYL